MCRRESAAIDSGGAVGRGRCLWDRLAGVQSRPVVRPDTVIHSHFQLPGAGAVATARVEVDSPRAVVLLSHGFTGSKEDFWPLLPLLAERGYLPVAFDKRGQFESVSAGPFELTDFVGDTVALARLLADRTGAPVHLLGHSWGGLEAAAAVVAAPEAFASLTLMCSGPVGMGPAPDIAQLLDALTAGVGLLEIDDQRSAGQPQDVGRAFYRLRFCAGNPRSLAGMARALMEAPDRIDQVAATGTPAFVVRGVDDAAWPHPLQDEMAQRLGCTVQVIGDAAHSPNIEAPAALARVLAGNWDRL